MADERDFAYGGLASGRLWTGGKTQRDAQFTVEENMITYVYRSKNIFTEGKKI